MIPDVTPPGGRPAFAFYVHTDTDEAAHELRRLTGEDPDGTHEVHRTDDEDEARRVADEHGDRGRFARVYAPRMGVGAVIHWRNGTVGGVSRT